MKLKRVKGQRDLDSKLRSFHKKTSLRRPVGAERSR
jgi:hypothetical protein